MNIKIIKTAIKHCYDVAVLVVTMTLAAVVTGWLVHGTVQLIGVLMS